jgi:ribosome-associated toxin RatA of RatAB toxin-antitoxin module
LQATATSSPIFKYLRTVWEFEPAPSSQPEAPRTTIDFSLRYAFANPLLAAVARASCERMAREMIGAFEKRAAVVYGQPRQQAR